MLPYEFSHEPRVAVTARLQVWFCSANRDSQQAQYTRFREALNSCLRRLPVNTSLLHDGNKKKKLQTKTPKTNHCSKSTETSAERSRNFLSDNSGSCPKCKGRIDRMWKNSTAIFIHILGIAACDHLHPKMPGNPGCCHGRAAALCQVAAATQSCQTFTPKGQ